MNQKNNRYYKFLIVFVLFSTQTFAKVFISDESIKLQKVWESPKSSLKQKIKIIYHDLKEPFPWGINLWKAYHHAWDTYIDIEFGEKTTLKDRALLRMYNNKGLATVLGLGALSMLSIVALGKMGLLPKHIPLLPRNKYFDSLNILELQPKELEGKTPETRKKILKKRYFELAKTRHPDKGGTQQEFTNLKDAYDFLLKYYHIGLSEE